MKIKVKLSPDREERRISHEWQGILTHHTGTSENGKVISIIDWLTRKDETKVSCHYIIPRDGETIYMVVDPAKDIAYHAGVSLWYDFKTKLFCSSCNQTLIGIEWEGDGNNYAFSESQYKLAGILYSDLIKAFRLKIQSCFLGHENVSPNRKFDPGRLFSWEKLLIEIGKNL